VRQTTILLLNDAKYLVQAKCNRFMIAQTCGLWQSEEGDRFVHLEEESVPGEKVKSLPSKRYQTRSCKKKNSQETNSVNADLDVVNFGKGSVYKRSV